MAKKTQKRIVVTGNSNNNAAQNNQFVLNSQCQSLNFLINDRTSNIHKIDTDIEELEQAINDIDRAINGFRDAANDVEVLEAEVTQVFKGEAADAFINKIIDYRSYCLKRIDHMEKLKANYSKQISDLRYQKVLAQNLISSLRESLEKLRRSCIV